MNIQTNINNKKWNYATITISPDSGAANNTISKNAQFWLYVLGTEKHESRRIDNQLRWRSGRQWDPWISQFYVALDDEIMRKMWGDTIKSIAKRLLPKEELDSIELTQSQFTSSITRAQKQMEWYNFGIRKHLFEYDNVVNKQRINIYNKRDQILTSVFDNDFDAVIVEIRGFISEIVTHYYNKLSTLEGWETEFFDTINQIFWLELNQDDFQVWRSKSFLHETIFRLEEMYDHKIWSYENKPILFDFLKSVYLDILDKYWVDHIDDMHYLRDKVGLYGYAQQDPLILYKQEWYNKFLQLWIDIKSDILSNVFKADLNLLINRYIPESDVNLDVAYDNKWEFENVIQDMKNIAQNLAIQTDSGDADKLKIDIRSLSEDGVEVIDMTKVASTKLNEPFVTDKKIWPNELCPCGSGKKYKKCHGAV